MNEYNKDPSGSDSDEVTIMYTSVKPAAANNQNSTAAAASKKEAVLKKRDALHLPSPDARPRKQARLNRSLRDESGQEWSPSVPARAASRARSRFERSASLDELETSNQNISGQRASTNGHTHPNRFSRGRGSSASRSRPSRTSPVRTISIDPDLQDSFQHSPTVPRPDLAPDSPPAVATRESFHQLVPVKQEEEQLDVGDMFELYISEEERKPDLSRLPTLRAEPTNHSAPRSQDGADEALAFKQSQTSEPFFSDSEDRKPTAAELQQQTHQDFDEDVPTAAAFKPRQKPLLHSFQDSPQHFYSPRLPLLKRNLPPKMADRKWGGQCRDVHLFLSHSEKINESTQKVSNRPDCLPGQFSVSNPTIRYTFTKCCVDHAQIEELARLRSWLFADACPWCVGTEERPVFSTTNVPDLLAHLQQNHSRFSFEARRDFQRFQNTVRILTRCQHDKTPTSSDPSFDTRQPQSEAIFSVNGSAPPIEAAVADTEMSHAEHRLVPYGEPEATSPTPSTLQPVIPASSFAGASFVDICMSHAQMFKDWEPSKLPPAVNAKGFRYTPQYPPGWEGSNQDKPRIRQVFHTTKKPYLRTLDFAKIDRYELCSDSEDDDGENYHWESHFQQMKLGDQPDVDENAKLVQQIWYNTCRSMGDAHRSQPYEACVRLVTSYASTIHSRDARKELVEHLAAMASLHTITPDQAEVLLQRYDRKTSEDARSNGTTEQSLVAASRPLVLRQASQASM